MCNTAYVVDHAAQIATYKICSVRMGPGESGEITPSAATPKALDPEAIDATPRDTGDHEDAPQVHICTSHAAVPVVVCQ